MKFDRKIYFDTIRPSSMFGGSMSQQQVDGQETILAGFENKPATVDLRHNAYMLATTFHETAATMQPIEEYGKGSGHDYGNKDPETGQTYYGRGYVQLTWRDNYKRATQKIGLTGDDDLEWHAQKALDPDIAYLVLSRGMMEGWFTGKSLPQYFSATANDPVGARKIINPDDKGSLISGYHKDYLKALETSLMSEEPPSPAARVDITTVGEVEIYVNGKKV